VTCGLEHDTARAGSVKDDEEKTMKRKFKILSINISSETGIQKKPVERALIRVNHGIEGDAHAGDWHRQISLLATEDIDQIRGKGIELNYGDFAENITTEDVDLSSLPIGTRLYIGDTILEVTQIGKECHHGCAIYQIIGDCVMPRKGIFARVIQGGEIDIESECYYDL
jgi:MOSC domain-containing protein YiiM